MILGMSTATFTLVHVALSLAGIASGLMVVFGMIRATSLPTWNGVFLATTALTSLTGFLFPYKGVTPGIVVGILSTAVLLLAGLALYLLQLAGGWRGTYVISAVLALYFNFVALIAQSFEKVPALNALAPTLSEPPFKIAQILAFVLFATLAVLAFKRYRIASPIS